MEVGEYYDLYDEIVYLSEGTDYEIGDWNSDSIDHENDFIVFDKNGDVAIWYNVEDDELRYALESYQDFVYKNSDTYAEGGEVGGNMSKETLKGLLRELDTEIMKAEGIGDFRLAEYLKVERKKISEKLLGTTYAEGGEVSKYKTGISKYGKNEYAVRVDIGDKDLIPKLLNDRWDSKSEAEAFAKRLAKRNNGTYVGEDGIFAKGGSTYAEGGKTANEILSFSFNLDNVSLKQIVKIVEIYTKDWKTSGDISNVNMHVILPKSKAHELELDLKGEDVYDIERRESRYAKGGVTPHYNVIALEHRHNLQYGDSQRFATEKEAIEWGMKQFKSDDVGLVEIDRVRENGLTDMVFRINDTYPLGERVVMKPYAKGGQTTSPITNYHKNIMGTLSFDLKVKGMRKPQDFIVYPIREKTDTIKIQSDKKFGEINILTGRGILSKSGSAMYHLSLDKARNNVNEFHLSKGEVQELKTQIKSTTGKSVGGSFVKSDNSAADLLEKGGSVIGDNIDNAFLNASKKSELFLDVNYANGKSKTIPIKTKTLKGIEQQAEDLFDLDKVNNIQLVRFWGDSKKVDIAVDLMAKGGKTRKKLKK